MSKLSHSRERMWHLIWLHFTSKGVVVVNAEAMKQAYLLLGFAEPSQKALNAMMYNFRKRKLGGRLRHGWILLNTAGIPSYR